MNYNKKFLQYIDFLPFETWSRLPLQTYYHSVSVVSTQQCREESESSIFCLFHSSREGRFWSFSFAPWILVSCVLSAHGCTKLNTGMKRSRLGTFLLSTTDVTVSTQLGALVPGKAEAQWLWGEGASCESACSLVRLRDVGQWWWGGCGGARTLWLASI